MRKYRVWWNPMPATWVPAKSNAFIVNVTGLVEAKKVLDVLADYDNYLTTNKIAGDYNNTGGLEEFDPDDHVDSPDGSWAEWESSDGDNIADISHEEAVRIDRIVRR
jgi:hypothetical protein